MTSLEWSTKNNVTRFFIGLTCFYIYLTLYPVATHLYLKLLPIHGQRTKFWPFFNSRSDRWYTSCKFYIAAKRTSLKLWTWLQQHQQCLLPLSAYSSNSFKWCVFMFFDSLAKIWGKLKSFKFTKKKVFKNDKVSNGSTIKSKKCSIAYRYNTQWNPQFL